MAVSDADVNDSDLDGYTEQIEWIEGAETSSHEGENLSVSVVDSDLDESTKQTEWDEGRCLSDSFLMKVIHHLVMELICYDEEILRDEDDKWKRLIVMQRKLERMVSVIGLMAKLEALFELLLYVCLILETSTSKQTRRSKEDKCIVHILLLRSGVESNPGPRTWIDYLRGSDKPTKDDLMYLSGRIGNGWRHLGAKLRLRQAQLDHIEHDHKGMQNQIYHMLLETTKSELEASLKDILLMLDVASTEITMTVDWDDITLRFDNGQEQQILQKDATDRMFARLADIENTIATLQAKQAEHEELKIKVTCLQAENKELKTEIASLKRGAEKRNAEEGETSTDVKRVKHQ